MIELKSLLKQSSSISSLFDIKSFVNNVSIVYTPSNTIYDFNSTFQYVDLINAIR